VATPSASGGFAPEALQFLTDLAEHNDRAWFQPRKAEYERLLKEPMEALVVALGERFAARGIPIEADPRHAIFRIYRDVRFSKDKSPYKTHISASLPWIEPGSGAGSPGHGNGAYVHIQPEHSYVGGGMWHPEKARLDAFRQAIVDDPDRARAVLEDAAFLRRLGPLDSHETLKRVPPGYPADHPMSELLRYKDLTFGRALSDDEVVTPLLPDILADDLAAAVPVFRFLASLDRVSDTAGRAP
jgi:uncharacterized protein (TIGR02453 family)